MFKRAFIVLAMCLAFGTATAELRIAVPKNMLFAPSEKTLAPDMDDLPPLIPGHAISVSRAFGDDDEDCIVVTQAAIRPGGSKHLTHKVVCEE